MNSGFGALEVAVVHGRGSSFLTPRRGAVPLQIICGYFWRLKGLESDRQPSEPSFLPLPPLDPHSAATEVEEEEDRSPRVPLSHGIQAPETWRRAEG